MNVGFFYIRNAPIQAQMQHEFIKMALELFELPLEKKLEIEMVNSPHFLGYSRLGAEITALKPDHREQFDVSGILSFACIFQYSPNTLSSLQLNFPRLAQTSHCIKTLLAPTR